MALVVFLRGVNVGGHRTFRPTLLAQQLEHLGVVSVGAAGTFVVREEIRPSRLRAELRRRLPFETEVTICEGSELLEAAADHPFGDHPPARGVVRFVSVFGKPPRPRLPIVLPPEGRWLVKVIAARGRFLFGQYRREMKTIACLGALDRLLGARAATRNWNTVTQLCALL